jgi:thiol-disulfide isomerase/thioredoxin
VSEAETQTDAGNDEDTVDAAAHAIFDELDGEGQERLVGIMYSEKQWIVPESWKVIFLVCAVAMIGGLAWFTVSKRVELRRLQMDSVVEPTPMQATAAPDFVLPEGDSNDGVRLSDFKGKWVLINFWATWCPPCRDEMPSMEMLNRRFKDKGMVMVAVTVDEDWGEVTRFFGDTAPSFKVLWDKRKITARRYGTSKFPETYLVDPEGKVAAKFVGPRDWYNLGTVEYFEDILSNKRPPV